MVSKKGLFLSIIPILLWFGNIPAENLDIEALQRLINEKGYKWVAGRTSVSDLSFEEQKRLCGFQPIPFNEIADRIVEMPKVTPPPSFDWRDVEGHNWTTPVKRQLCGDCWAFATIAAFETVLKIAYNKPDTNINLSEQFVVSCDPYDHGCYGGTIVGAARFLEETGVPDEACFRYRGKQLPCSNRCPDWEGRVEKADDYGAVVGADNIKNAIMEYGPLGTAMLVYQDFMSYRGGVYRHTSGRAVGYHGISIFGWDDNQNCWIGKNSWGKGWGEDGWFKIAYNQCGVFSPNLCPGIWLERVDVTKPYVRLKSFKIEEPKDGIWDPGESVDISVTLTNRGLDLKDVKATLSTKAPYITITDNSSDFGPIPLGGNADNSQDPYKVVASKTAPSDTPVRFTLHITGDNGYHRDVEFEGYLGIKPGEVKRSFPAPNSDTGLVYGLAYDGTNLWVSEWFSNRIYKLNPRTGKIIGAIPTPEGKAHCVDIAWDYKDKVLWVQNNDSKKIYKVDPSNGRVLTSFPSPAKLYPTGLTFDGEHLWVADRDAYTIYEITKSGNTVRSFAVPIFPKPDYGPRGLAFEPDGPDGGSLLLVMTHWRGGDLDSTVLWEINRNGSLVKGHHFVLPPTNGRAVEVKPHSCEYWVNTSRPGFIYEVTGFYRGEPTGIEEPLTHKRVIALNFAVSPNPSRKRVSLSLSIPETRRVIVDVYDITGKRLSRVTDRVFEPGEYEILWNGRDDTGRRVPCGIYFFRLKSEGYTRVKKVILMR